jgi:hypothetical protein
MRFTLGKLFLAIALLALACAGMMYRNGWWSDGIFTLTIGIYVVALIWAIGLQSRQRTCALIFAAAGLGYLLFATMSCFAGAKESLLTNYPLAYAAKGLQTYGSTTQVPVTRYVPASSKNSAGGTVTRYLPQTQYVASAPPIHDIIQAQSTATAGSPLRSIFIIGHCVFSWLFALLAAWFAGQMYDRRSGRADLKHAQ